MLKTSLLRPSILSFAFAVVALMSGPPVRSGRSGMTAASAAELVSIDRTARDYKLPEQISWSKRADGVSESFLLGDPSKPGMYVQLSRRPPNNWTHPHFHNTDRVITVLDGTMWIGTGTKFAPENTVPLRAGSAVRDFANKPHFDGSKDDGFTIEIVGMGPATSTPAETK